MPQKLLCPTRTMFATEPPRGLCLHFRLMRSTKSIKNQTIDKKTVRYIQRVAHLLNAVENSGAIFPQKCTPIHDNASGATFVCDRACPRRLPRAVFSDEQYGMTFLTLNRPTADH